MRRLFRQTENGNVLWRKWSGITPEKFMQQVDAYIRWYNERRIKLSLGAVSPKMYRQQCGLE